MFRVADPDPIELPPISDSDPTKSLFETFSSKNTGSS